MRLKKQLLAFIFVFVCVSGLAQSGAEISGISLKTANANIIAPNTFFLTAPFAGSLLPFSWRVGDPVPGQEAVFEMDTVKVYAPQSGRLTALFGAPGDDAEGIAARYGALCVIEPKRMYYIEASTSTAYKNDGNKLIHAGETLYLKSGGEKGIGRVTSVAQGNYTVEIIDGSFYLNDAVTCYRESGYAGAGITGSGKVMRYNDVLINARGRIFAVHKREGDVVEAGDLLFEVIDSGSDPGTDSTMIFSPGYGAIAAVHVMPGSQVPKGQLLCEISDLTYLELSVQMDEIYIADIRVGDSLAFVLDAFDGQRFTGNVIRIMPLGSNRQNAAYYDVRVSLPENSGFLPGMNATVYIN